MGIEIRLALHAVDVGLERIGFDTIAVLIMGLSLLGMLLALTFCDGGGTDLHAEAVSP